MRELLRALYDRLGEVSVGYRGSRAEADLEQLRAHVGDVLDKGYFNGCYLELDVRQMPEVL